MKPFETVTAVYTKELDLRIPGTVRWCGIAAFLGINLSNLHLLWWDVLGFFCIPEDFKFTMDCQGWKMLLLAAQRRTCSVFSWRCAGEVLTCFFFTFTISFANESPHNTVDFGLTFLILWSKKKNIPVSMTNQYHKGLLLSCKVWEVWKSDAVTSAPVSVPLAVRVCGCHGDTGRGGEKKKVQPA